jgi:hypothetical protein
MPVAHSPAHFINCSKGCPSIKESFPLCCFLVLCATVAELPVVQPHWPTNKYNIMAIVGRRSELRDVPQPSWPRKWYPPTQFNFDYFCVAWDPQVPKNALNANNFFFLS